jgi:protein SCO1/2
MTAPSGGRPGGALTALMAILLITAAWWALALWPAVSPDSPDWLVRVRSACFGATAGGLPDAGGWILLLGEPAGMIGTLLVLWGRALGRDFRWVGGHRRWRLVAVTVALASVTATGMVAVRVARAWSRSRAAYAEPGSVIRRMNRALPALRLVDQNGRALVPGDLLGGTTLLTFAFGHCNMVCPVTVHELRTARRDAGRSDVRLLVITLDPWRDTPERLPSLAAHWGLGPHDRALSGTVADVEQALDALGVGRSRDAATGDVDHVTAALILDPAGRIAWRVEGGVDGVARLLARDP